MCRYCGDEKIASKTVHTQEIDDSLIVIRNVPCMMCDMCGEIFYDGIVSTKLEEIVDNATKLKQELAVIDYNKVV